MNGTKFVNVLKQLGINRELVEGRSFDWLFDYEQLLPFFDWFCEALLPTNVLDSSEIDEFNALEATIVKQGGIVLEGSQLNDALNNWSLLGDNSEDKQVTDEDVAQLHEQLRVAQRNKERLKSMHDRLMTHQMRLSERMADLNGVSTDAEAGFRSAMEQTQLDNAKMNKSTEALVPVVSELLSVYGSNSGDTLTAGATKVFLFDTNMDDYHFAEEQFTQHLVDFTKKRFFKGIEEIAGPVNGAECDLVEISNPNLLLVKGAREDVVLDACKELSYVQLCYPFSESKRINALVEEQSLLSACELKEKLVRQLKDHPYPSDLPSLRANLKSTDALLSMTTRDLMHLSNNVLPSQVSEAASLQVVKVLRGDYDLKIARQDYFTSNQDQVISQLVVQRSRNEFLAMAFEIELRWHRNLHKLLTALTLLLKQMHHLFQDEMKLAADLTRVSGQLDRTTVDSRDRFVQNIYQMLGDTSADGHPQPSALFVTYSKIEQLGEHLFHRLMALRASLTTANQNDHDKLPTLERELEKCTSIVYGDSGAASGLPLLSPYPIPDTMSQLDTLLKRLEQAVIGIIKDVDCKKKVLQKDSLMRTERELFTYFFNSANNLRRVMNDINSQLTARLSV